MVNGAWRRALILFGVAGALIPVLVEARGRLSALGSVEPGLWELREIGVAGAQPKALCLADLNELVQVQHRGLPCSQVVIDNEPDEATVHYTCPAGGFGRTSLRKTTSRVLVVDTQGIHENRPFAYRAEARRKGSCSPRRAGR